MDINLLYFLYRLEGVCEDYSQKGLKTFKDFYSEIEAKTEKEVISNIPDEVSALIEAACEDELGEAVEELKKSLAPYSKEAQTYLGDREALNERFFEKFSEILKENGYFVKEGVFRKSRRNRFFVIEAELVSTFVANECGKVIGISVSPLVRVADCPIKKNKKGEILVAGVNEDEVTVSDIKLWEPDAFIKNLRHLKTMEFKLGEEIELTDGEIEALAQDAAVAMPVCENRAIPAYYKRLCKNDFPFKKALTISAVAFICAFILLTLIIGLASGLAVYAIMGLKKILGLFAVPYFYLVTGIIAFLYAIIVFNKTRMGRY